jgi:hypothetical protein
VNWAVFIAVSLIGVFGALVWLSIRKNLRNSRALCEGLDHLLPDEARA